MTNAPVLDVRNLTVALPRSGDRSNAVEDISFAVHPGEIVCVVGESGSGKSVTASAVMGLLPAALKPIAGETKLEGEDTLKASKSRLRELRGTKMAMIFQEPMTALNPVVKVWEQIAEMLEIHTSLGQSERRKRAIEVMESVHLPDPQRMADSFPHQLSGGQRQRIGIARALAMEPDCIVCDEAVSALDVSIQGQIINLLEHLRETLGIAYLFIAHDLAVVRHISHRVAVMYLGEIVEIGTRDAIFDAPAHPYTRLLLEAVPIPDPMVEQRRHADTIKGEISAPLVNTKGCRFAPRCPLADEACRLSSPRLADDGQGRQVACFKV